MLGVGRRLFERRKQPRYSVSNDARILLRNGSFQMPCAIVEIARSGARLRPTDASLLPNEFELLVSPGKKVRCEAIHRCGNEIGVRFLS